MHLFGKKQKSGESRKKQSNQNTIKQIGLDRKKLLKYKTPSDVKLFYQMPIFLVIGFVLFLTGGIWIQHNANAYRQRVLASSMQYGENLPLWGGTAKGNLSLGHTKLSRDGRTLAVEIKYDDAAHQGLSSYGSRYKLRLVDTKDNRMSDVKMSYGIFGTDGSGVLQIKSPNGFKDKSFVVMLIDNGQLVTTDDLTQTQQMNDGDLDKSITAELSDAGTNSNTTDSNDTNNDSKRKNLPPLYYVRLNAHNAVKNYRDWSNDSEVIEDLFIKDNLKKIKKSMLETKIKLKKTTKTLAEMNRRLAENKNDEVAQEGKNQLETSVSSLKTNYASLQKRYEKLENATFNGDILNPKQKKYRVYTIENINYMN